MRNWCVEVCGSGGVTLWSAVVKAPSKPLAKAKALELMQRGGGWRPRLPPAAAPGKLTVRVSLSTIGGAWDEHLNRCESVSLE